MSNNTLTFQKTLYDLLLAALNVVGFIMIGVVFLGASNANGEGTPVKSEWIGFLRQLAYVIAVSLFFSLAALLLTRVFRGSLPRNNTLLKNIFWLQLVGLTTIFVLSYFYLWLKFA